MRTLQETFNFVFRIADMRDESNMGAWQVGAMGIVFNQTPHPPFARVIAYHLMGVITDKMDDIEYNEWLVDRKESIEAIMADDDPFNIRGVINDADHFFREAYGNHKWPATLWYEVDFNKVWEALMLYLTVMI